MTWATNSIEIATQRQLALLLREALAEDVALERSLIATPPESKRVTVLPPADPTETVDLYIGSGRAHRQHEFTVRTWTEVIGDDQDEVEDATRVIESAIEDVIAERSTLGDVDGLLMFGQSVQVTSHPIFQPQPGLYFAWVERQISATGRYD
jgi:hypothetical protein